MNKNFYLSLCATIMLAFGLGSCSNDEGLNTTMDLYGYYSNAEGDFNNTPSFSLGDMNVVQIQSDNGDTELCWLNSVLCGKPVWSTIVCEPDGSTHERYSLVFSAVVNYSNLFNVLQFEIDSDKEILIDSLKAGDVFDSSVIRFKAWQDSTGEGASRIQNSPWALGGQIEVVSLKSYDDGTVSFTLKLQDLKLDSWASCSMETNHTFNGMIEFFVNGSRIFPDDGFNMEEALIPSDYLISFMMDALYKNEFQGRQTFFSDDPEEQKCLIINSDEELRAAYKGDKEIPRPLVNFDHCTLVIGRTYGENGSISLGDFELTDNGDSYQLDVTLNRYVDPLSNYSADPHDLYFYKIYPKMENKPVVFNRIHQDIDTDPFGDDSPYALVHKRWLLQCYVDSDGNNHEVSTWGDERYTIEFKKSGIMEGIINTNEFSGYYTLPYMCTIDGKRDGYNDNLYYGLINLQDWTVTELNDDEPLSKVFMHIFDATEIKFWTQNIMRITTSDGEFFCFFSENIKEIYGYD